MNVERRPAGEAGGAPDFEHFYLASWTRSVRLAGLLTQDASVAEEISQEAFVAVFHRSQTCRVLGDIWSLFDKRTFVIVTPSW